MQQGRATLLIAEDEDSNYLLLKTVLQKQCDLIRARTGIEAINLFEENQEVIDLILLDIKMPEMEGIEALKEIRKISKDIPIVMQSAYVFDTDMEAARKGGANDFITKPINLKILKSTVNRFCPSVVW
jgi:CheY-like chemotaxis protein